MKKIWVICLALIWLLPQAALAHSKLVETVPEKDSTLESSPQEIRLSFNTKIEKISSFKLFDEGGAEVTLGDTFVEGDTMSNRPSAPLGNGEYTVKWTIVGADGHAIDGQYGFSVATETATATPTPEPTSPAVSPSADAEPSQEPGASAEPSPTIGNEASPSPSPSVGETDDDEGGSGMNPLIAVGGVILIVAVAAVLLRRRKP